MKKSIQTVLSCLLLSTLFACKLVGSSSGADASAGSVPTKSLFSTWTFTGQNWSVNMSGFNESGTTVSGKWQMSDGSYCTCNFTLVKSAGSGDATSGTLNTAGCITSTSGSDEAAAFCPYLNGSATYSHTGTTLQILFPTHSNLSTYN